MNKIWGFPAFFIWIMCLFASSVQSGAPFNVCGPGGADGQEHAKKVCEATCNAFRNYGKQCNWNGNFIVKEMDVCICNNGTEQCSYVSLNKSNAKEECNSACAGPQGKVNWSGNFEKKNRFLCGCIVNSFSPKK